MSRHRGLRSISVVVLALGALSGCTSEATERTSSEPSLAPTEPQPASSAAADLTCEAPSKAVLARARVAIAAHPGPVRGSTIVPAAKTRSGRWYVIAIDREHVLDNGATTGTGSRSLGLTNAVDRHPAASKMIPIGEGTMGGTPTLTWDNVTWSGDELAAGERAAERAVECLDAATP